MTVGMSLRETLKNIPAARRLNAAVKGPLQALAATRSQWKYEWRARASGGHALEDPELWKAVRSRIAARREGRPPAAIGELHLFLAYPLANWEAVLPVAFAPFGRVTVFEWRSLGFDDRAPDWASRRDAMNRAMLAAFDDAQSVRPVDAVVGYLSGHNTAPETLREMAGRGAAVFNFCWDDKLNFPGPRVGGRYSTPAAIASSVDLTLTNAPASVVKYAVHGGLAVFAPEAALPSLHRPHEVPFEFDVSFVGARYGWRPQFIERLARRGVLVECFGRGWPNGPLSDEEMVRLYSRSRINLGFGGVGYSRSLVCLKGRDFEVPMSGGLYLTQENPELRLVFDVGREVVTYRDERDCARKIRHLLDHPDEAARIREAGRERALRDHTYLARWGSVFRQAGLLSENRCHAA